MGLLTPEDWQAKWISAPGGPGQERPAGAAVSQGIYAREAAGQRRVYICGLGYYELHLNGGKVGDHVLDPAFTRYDRRALYVTYDVTRLLKKGPERPRRDARQRLVQHAHRGACGTSTRPPGGTGPRCCASLS